MDTDARASDYRHFVSITTRWMDNDVYGHINNVTFYSYFDTAANLYLIEKGKLEIHTSPVIALVVESKCAYRKPLAYPDSLRAGLRVDKLGSRSVTYGIAIFREGEDVAAAFGHFVHVFVDRNTRQSVPIPAEVRLALEAIVT
jgi:acyl-CoA thioester hydrolase